MLGKSFRFAWVVAFLFLSIASAKAQVYTQGKTRHRFAQVNVGTDLRYFPKTKYSPMEAYTEPRIIIGGYHFWGHADFYLGIPLRQSGSSGFGNRVETGARYYPWRMEHGKIRPFIGASWMFSRYRKGEGAEHLWRCFPVSAGITFMKGNHSITAAAGYVGWQHFDYYSSQTTKTRITSPNSYFSLAYNFIFDGTLSAEKSWQSGQTKKLTDTLSQLGRLDGWTLGFGISSAFYLAPSSRNEASFPYLGQHKISRLFMEWVVGYFWQKRDVQANLVYRTIRSSQSAYGLQQNLMRRAFTAEAYHFFADYHGFVPFIGPALSAENWELKETGIHQYKKNIWSVRPGLSFGWDIRPNSLQAWYLRTNLRWFPAMNLKDDQGTGMNMSQIEFNFIELVVFPGRMF